jgi:hypothetical protein
MDYRRSPQVQRFEAVELNKRLERSDATFDIASLLLEGAKNKIISDLTRSRKQDMRQQKKKDQEQRNTFEKEALHCFQE